MEQILDIFLNLFSFETLFIAFIGTLIGVVLGGIPGLNGGIGIAVLLPFTYTFNPAMALLFLGGIYMGSSYGGSISAILINCPGTVQATCTATEGNPMAMQGKGREALYYSVLASSVGGLFGVIALIFFTPPLAALSVKFGPPEMLLISICGLTIVGSISGKNFSKGIFAALFGLFLGLIGMHEVSGIMRYTFGLKPFTSGIDIIPAVIGLFAITEMIKQGKELKKSSSASITNIVLEKTKAFSVFKKMMTKYRTVTLKSSILGTIVGILPGTGGAIAAFLAYGEAKRSSKEKELFGKGSAEGLIAAESANNGAVGGSLVPMLALGIPGSSNSAIMFGAMTIHGLLPGRRLFVENAEISYTFLFGMLFTVVFMLIIGIYGVPLFSQILKIKMEYIIPAVIACSLIGTYSSRNSMIDVLFACLFAILGVFFSKFEIPASPILLGLILGSIIESNFARTLTIASAQNINPIQYIITRPLSIVILALTIYLIYSNAQSAVKEKQIKEEISNTL